MKLLRFTLLINLLSILAIGEVSACVGPYYLPSGYYMYRGYEPQPAEGEVSNRMLNCREWQLLTSVSISIEEIEKVVYEMPYDEFEILCRSSHIDNRYKFFRWIKQFDNEALECLRLAKENEFIRVCRNSRWYYPSMKIPSRRTLEDIAEEALASTSERFRDRYLLQAVRALFTLGRFEECVDVWEGEASKLPKDNLMRRMIQPYIAGAAFRLNHNEKAIRHFAELGDIGSMKFCAKKQGGEVPILEMLYKYCLDRTIIYSYVQRLIRNAEPLGCVDGAIKLKHNTPNLTSQHNELYTMALKFAQLKDEKNPAFWYYTAAFIDDMRGNTQRASDILALAERAKGSDYINESIKVLRIYLDAKRLPYNEAYEKRLFEQLKWLDGMICNNITPKVIDQTANMDFRSNISYYYWNDMLRRIMLSEVCPRMIKAGKRVRALQLANMTDNRLLKLVGFISSWSFDEDDINTFMHTAENGNHLWAMHLEAFRHHNKQHNYIDYGNNFFHMIDSLDSKTAIAYFDNSSAPKSDFDRFLNARSYVGEDYLRDIVGTLSLREMNYEQAERYYAPIKPSFYGHLNVVQRWDPFSINKPIYDEKNFRYKFAKQMCELQREIETTADENKKAMLMLSYAIGMFNSVGQNWSLTYYKKGCNYACCEFPQSEKVREQAAKIIAEAEATASDREIKAAIQYELCNFKHVAICYPDTELGKIVRGQCDKLIDYHAERMEEWRYYVNRKTY